MHSRGLGRLATGVDGFGWVGREQLRARFLTSASSPTHSRSAGVFMKRLASSLTSVGAETSDFVQDVLVNREHLLILGQ
jgi:hypothetical protein